MKILQYPMNRLILSILLAILVSENVSVVLDENGGNTIMASQLNNIRLKLEEKRRHIENEKRRMEVVMSKQRQKVGKAAFLQAVTKVKHGIISAIIILEKLIHTTKCSRTTSLSYSNSTYQFYCIIVMIKI
jgi:hypothetical protein